MLKFVIVGLVFTTVSTFPLDSIPSGKHVESHTYTELVRPSPINPDIPIDPKPPERIILEDGNERDSSSLIENTFTVEKEPHENLKTVSKNNDENIRENKSNDEKVSEKSEDKHSDAKFVGFEHKHDDVRNNGASQTENEEPSNQSFKSSEPIIVHAVKPDEKQRSESFQTSHRIPNVGETERQFQTSHHIPTHIDSERQKLIETSKVGESSQN